jgi:hypothetical protein
MIEIQTRYRCFPTMKSSTVLFSTQPENASVAIDDKMAQSILDRLGYTLQDLALEYGDVVIFDNDISHQLYYGSEYNAANLMGYVWLENGIYYTGAGINHKSPELAALDLLERHLVVDTAYAIELERATAKDYF